MALTRDENRESEPPVAEAGRSAHELDVDVRARSTVRHPSKDSTGAGRDGLACAAVRSPRTLLLALGAIAIVAGLATSPPAGARSHAAACEPREAGVNCGPGNNRRTAGGGDKVPHHDGAGRRWPAISGILWHVLDGGGRRKSGSGLNDELLGHHGSDALYGGAGHDVIWGDWDPKGNTTRQRDLLSGGPGNDWLYPSHGRSIVLGGPGNDYVWAFYGTGLIDCGPGRDTARIRTTGAFRTRNCERIRHFCAHGEHRDGRCLTPTGRPVGRAPRG